MQDALTNYFEPKRRRVDTPPLVEGEEPTEAEPFVWAAPETAYETTPAEPAKAPPQEPFDTILGALQTSTGITLSQEQVDICRAVYEGDRHLIIDSVAGSGKTTTLLYCLWFLPVHVRILLLSFNKHVQETLQLRVAQTGAQIQRALGRDMARCEVRTSHAHGYAALRRHYGAGMDEEGRDNKLSTIDMAIQAEANVPSAHTHLKKWKWHMVTLLRMLMNLAVDCTPETQWTDAFIERVAATYEIPIPRTTVGAVTKKARAQNEAVRPFMRVLHRAYTMCCNRVKRFDYNDMAFLPIRNRLDLTQYDVVGVDEAQDQSAIQIEMVARSLAPGGRVILVGDANQAIYGFRGCQTEAMEVMRRRFDALLLPLHICWRCPRAVVECAANLVPRIRARPNAPEGGAYSPSDEQLMEFLQYRDTSMGHLVLCRTNAPLVELAIRLQKGGVPCSIRATSVYESMKKALRQIDDPTKWWGKGGSLLDRCEKYREWKRKTIEEGGETGIEQNDQLDVLHTIIKSFGYVRRLTAENVLSRMEAIFGNFSGAPGTIQMMTIHQAKGMEVDCVYVIRTDLLPHPNTNTLCMWQMQQEDNCKYVAITRAKQELYYFSASSAINA